MSQWTWRGRSHLKWEDVTDVTRDARSMTLTAGGVNVLFPIDRFYDSKAPAEYVHRHLPAAIRKS